MRPEDEQEQDSKTEQQAGSDVEPELDPEAEHESRLLQSLRRWREGDEQAREEVIELTYERIRQRTHVLLCRYPRLRRWEQTDDIAQDAAMKLHRALEDVQPDTAAYLFNLATLQVKRILNDRQRKYFGSQGQGAHHETNAAASDSPEPPKYDQGGKRYEPQSLAEWTEFHEAAESLPERWREVFNLKFYVGLKNREIAETLGVSESTVNRVLTDVKEAMRVRMPDGPPRDE